jgi:bacterioferritin-associated ferredoxin
VDSFAQLQARTGCSDCCGACEPEARQCLRDAVEQTRSVLTFLPNPA